MSTKVYEAYKLSRSYDFWKLVTAIQRRARENVSTKLFEFCMGITIDAWYKPLDKEHFVAQRLFGGTSARGHKYLPPWEVFRAVQLEYRDQLARSERNYFNLDVSMTVRQVHGSWFLIPYCDRGTILSGVLDFLKDSPKALSDASYWNNTDRPENVSKRQWEYRKIIWEKATDGQNWHDYLAIPVCDWSSLYLFDPILKVKERIAASKNKAWKDWEKGYKAYFKDTQKP